MFFLRLGKKLYFITGNTLITLIARDKMLDMQFKHCTGNDEDIKGHAIKFGQTGKLFFHGPVMGGGALRRTRMSLPLLQ